MRMVVVLPAPFGPKKTNNLALGDFKRNVVDGNRACVSLGKAFDRNHRILGSNFVYRRRPRY